MPVDAHGNSADIVVDDASPVNRSNLGRLYYHYFASASREVQYQLKQNLGVIGKTSKEYLSTLDPTILIEAYKYILSFYKIVDEVEYQYYLNNLTDEEKIEHIAFVINNEVYVNFPIETDKNTKEVVIELEKQIKPLRGPVTYRGDSGKLVTTKTPVRIAPIYMMLLEKITDNYSSVSTGKLQVTGVLAGLNKTDRHRNPYRNTPVKWLGETENRLMGSYCDAEVIAEIIDRSNSSITQENMVRTILEADQPTNIDVLIDREVIEYGGSKPIQLVRHMANCAGFDIVYEPEEMENKA